MLSRNAPKPASDEATYRFDQARGAVRVPKRRASILLIGESTAGAALRERSPLVVGRSTPSDVVVEDPSLSRQHARVAWEDQRVIVEDLGSTNGVILDGKRVDRAEVDGSSEVFLGGVRMLVHLTSQRPTRGTVDENTRFAERVRFELVRARELSRSLAVIALRHRGVGSMPGWENALRVCLRPIDMLSAQGTDVALIALIETTSEDVPSWLARFRKVLTDLDVVCSAAVCPEHSASEAVITTVLDGLRSEIDLQTGDLTRVFPKLVRSPPTPRQAVVIESAPMKALYALLPRVARTRMPILIQGETGVGKEVVAHAVHTQSPRRDGPFKPINCATIPASLTESTLFGHEKGAFTGAGAQARGLFEQAIGGTVFLDEIGELPLQAQAALLRVLDTKKITRVGGASEIEVDVRVVAATHRDLTAMVETGRFRSDLLYRIDAVALDVPPLRERLEDIPPLARLFLEGAAEHWGTSARELDAAVLEALCAYAWPGNVRQLRNVVERAAAIALGPRIVLADLPPDIADGAALVSAETNGGDSHRAPSLRERMSRYERFILTDALRRSGGNQSEAARLLGVPRRTLANKVKRHGLG